MTSQKKFEPEIMRDIEAISLYRSEQKLMEDRKKSLDTLADTIEIYLQCLYSGDEESLPSIIKIMIKAIHLTAMNVKTNKKLAHAEKILIIQLMRKKQKTDYTLDLISYFISCVIDAIAGDSQQQAQLKMAIYLSVMEKISLLDQKVFVVPKEEKLRDKIRDVLKKRGVSLQEGDKIESS